MISLALLLGGPLGSALSLSSSKHTSRLERRWDNGLAQTPPMGWNSYNHYSCSPNESIITSNAQALVELGLADLGYDYVTTDCGWTLPQRAPDGTLTWNETLFPSGFPALGEFIHGIGLHFGVYSDGGVQMCMTGGVNQTGSLYHEQLDAATFASWGADLLKYDNCYSDADLDFPNTSYEPSESPQSHYVAMHNALIATNRSVVYQICDWGVDFPSAWAPALGNTWRVTNDIIPQWKTIYRIVNQVVPQTSYAGPHQWLDLDMLEVGNNLFTIPEEQTHFSLWAILKSPLVIGAALNDTLTSISPESLAILKNEDVIAFNQDSLGVSANLTRRWTEEGYDIWSGHASGDRTIVALVNWNETTLNATLDLPDVGLQSAGYVKDIWNNVTTRNVQTSYSQTVPPHGTLLLELGDTSPAGFYAIDEASNGNSTFTINKVYGFTDSTTYSMTINFATSSASETTIKISTSASQQKARHILPAHATSLTIPISLLAANNNSITLTRSSDQPTPISLTISSPNGTFHPSTSFVTSGSAQHVNCTSNLCAPVGAKIGNITPSGSASLRIPHAPSQSSNDGDRSPGTSLQTKQRYVSLIYINNEVALDSAWTDGRNARNITVSVTSFSGSSNSSDSSAETDTKRLEVPLSGRSSELFSEMRGWGDGAELGILIGGWGTDHDGDESEDDEGGYDEIVISNVGGDEGVQSFGADFVGLTIY